MNLATSLQVVPYKNFHAADPLNAHDFMVPEFDFQAFRDSCEGGEVAHSEFPPLDGISQWAVPDLYFHNPNYPNTMFV